MLKKAEAGAKTAELARHHGVPEATIYNWKSKYGRLAVSDAKRLRALEDENAKLKRLLAEAMRDNAGLKDLIGDAGCQARGDPSPSIVGMSERRACRVIGADRKSMRSRSQGDDAEVRSKWLSSEAGSATDTSIIYLRRKQLLETAISSKIFSCLAMTVPTHCAPPFRDTEPPRDYRRP